MENRRLKLLVLRILYQSGFVKFMQVLQFFVKFFIQVLQFFLKFSQYNFEFLNFGDICIMKKNILYH